MKRLAFRPMNPESKTAIIHRTLLGAEPMTVDEICAATGFAEGSVRATISGSINRDGALFKSKASKNSRYTLTKAGLEPVRQKRPAKIEGLFEEVEVLRRLTHAAERRLDEEITGHAATILGEEYAGRENDLEWTTAWGCPGPLDICVYDDVHDPANDDCLFCHEPRERK